MPDTLPPHRRYPADALRLLAELIKRHRIEHRMTMQQLADRLEVSSKFVQRIEAADPGCAIGKVFEAAAIVGIRLFDIDEVTMAARISETKAALELLPRSVRMSGRPVKDDF